MKIVVLDGYTLNPGDLSWNGIKRLGDLTVYPRTSEADIVTRAAEAEILLTNKTPLKAEVINQLPQLKYIGVLATGYNVVDIEAARQKGIIVTNIPSYSTESVAQMVFAHLLAITNHVEHYAQENKNGKWCQQADFSYSDYPLIELTGKKIGIIGLGHIGHAVARIAKAFGMEIHAFTSKTETECGPDIHKDDMNSLFAGCDIITLHCPLTPSTRHLVNKERLNLMKSSAILINTGRGPLVDEHAVADALRQGKLAAYGADVLDVEPPTPDNPLLTAPNVFLTPHIAWATVEARQRLMTLCEANIAAFIKGEPQNVVNLC